MKKILFLGLIAFIVTAIWLLPLSFAKPYAEKMVPGLKLEQVSGTVWNGEAKHLTANNIYLGKVNWTVKPLPSLLSASLKTQFNIEGENLSANGLSAITPAKKLVLSDTSFDVDAEFINKFQNNAKLAGAIQGNIVQAELVNKKVPLIDGVIDWKEGAITSPIKLDRGDYRAVLASVSEGLDIKLSSSDAPIELNGDIKLKNDWAYETNVNAKGNNPSISAMLNLAGKPQTNGFTSIKQKGDLKPFIGL